MVRFDKGSVVFVGCNSDSISSFTELFANRYVGLDVASGSRSSNNQVHLIRKFYIRRSTTGEIASCSIISHMGGLMLGICWGGIPDALTHAWTDTPPDMAPIKIQCHENSNSLRSTTANAAAVKTVIGA